MDKSELDPRVLEQIQKLEEKYEAMGQDISSYLDGLLHADYLTYWDYIHIDTLLSLQNPKTSLKDEVIFIIYHQITELYFRMVLWETDQLVLDEDLTVETFKKRLNRIINYFENLANSFDIMIDGMEKEQFLKFRMSLLPASGFQSAQYRLIEFACTDLINLVSPDKRNSSGQLPLREQYENIYWKQGATELATGKKTLTLKQFEEKYLDDFMEFISRYETKNINRIYLEKFAETDEGSISKILRKLDALININWCLSHYKSAVRYLQKDPEDIKATGGTNWQKYLPPRFQKIVFFPTLHNPAELKEWGKSWVKEEVFGQKGL
ncbi:MAG TPA: tryptophan 2,3-dioxygenase family protein [Cyclobacteriaceae bacterium]|jgi:tryptophan 2,3-dioxygenase